MKKNFFISLAYLLPLVFFSNSIGQTVRPQDPVSTTRPGEGLSDAGVIVNPLRVDNVQELLAVILSAIVQIAIPFLVLALMWVGFLFVAARGNPEKLSKAKQALWYTLLGALIILGAQTLSVVLSGTISQLVTLSTTQY
ncbi:MAG: pilin [Minisyncoccia bacterium]